MVSFFPASAQAITCGCASIASLKGEVYCNLSGGVEGGEESYTWWFQIITRLFYTVKAGAILHCFGWVISFSKPKRWTRIGAVEGQEWTSWSGMVKDQGLCPPCWNRSKARKLPTEPVLTHTFWNHRCTADPYLLQVNLLSCFFVLI